MNWRRLPRCWTHYRRSMPWPLRFEFFVPATMAIWIVAGTQLTMPPGPLCDEGMVLFMEGGCDWGLSNLFFFSKASLLLAFQYAMIAAWRQPPRSWLGFLPHFALLITLSFTFRSGGYCNTYYAQPNGSLGQMLIEMCAFASLGIAVNRALGNAGWPTRLAALGAWNVLHVGLFYLFLIFAPHWSWPHTIALACALILATGLLEHRRSSP